MNAKMHEALRGIAGALFLSRAKSSQRSHMSERAFDSPAGITGALLFCVHRAAARAMAEILVTEFRARRLKVAGDLFLRRSPDGLGDRAGIRPDEGHTPGFSVCSDCSRACFSLCFLLFLHLAAFRRQLKALHCRMQSQLPCKSPVFKSPAFFRKRDAATSGRPPRSA